MREKKENYTFRALYLIAICFVVDGHIPLEGELLNFGGLFRYYSFHMMLFAFGSGYFMRGDRTAKDALKRDALHLLVPLYIWNAVYGVIALVLRRWFGATLGAPLTLWNLLAAPLVDGQQFSYNLGAWFIGALFLLKVAYRGLYQLAKQSKYWDLLCLAASLALGSLAVACSRDELPFTLPVFILRPMILLPGYAMGVVYRERLEKLDKLPTLPYLCGIVILRLLFNTLVPEQTYLLSDCSYMPCGAVGIYVGAVLAIAFYLRIARLFSTYLQKSRFLTYASRHTFDIMMHHGLGIWLLNFAFLLLNWSGLGASDFSVSALRTQGGYTYAPGGMPEYAIAYLFAGVVFSCLAAWVTEWIKHMLHRGRQDGSSSEKQDK